jgi:hypothetical protein
MASSSSFIFTLARAEGVAQVLQHEESLHAKISRAFTLATGDIPHAAPDYQEACVVCRLSKTSVGILLCWWSMPNSTG